MTDKSTRRCSRGSVFVRCGCRGHDGRQIGSSCPQTGERGHGSWSFEVSVSGPVSGPGHQRLRVRRGGFATASAARTALAAYRRRGDQACIAGGWTTGRWLGHWLQTHHRVRASTRRSYASHIRLYLAPTLGRIPLDELTAQDIQTMIDDVIAQHTRVGRPITPATVARLHATLRIALKSRCAMACSPPTPPPSSSYHRTPGPIPWSGHPAG